MPTRYRYCVISLVLCTNSIAGTALESANYNSSVCAECPGPAMNGGLFECANTSPLPISYFDAKNVGRDLHVQNALITLGGKVNVS